MTTLTEVDLDEELRDLLADEGETQEPCRCRLITGRVCGREAVAVVTARCREHNHYERAPLCGQCLTRFQNKALVCTRCLDSGQKSIAIPVSIHYLGGKQ